MTYITLHDIFAGPAICYILYTKAMNGALVLSPSSTKFTKNRNYYFKKFERSWIDVGKL